MTGFDHLLLPILFMFGVICLIYGVALAFVVDVLIGRLETKNENFRPYRGVMARHDPTL